MIRDRTVIIRPDRMIRDRERPPWGNFSSPPPGGGRRFLPFQFLPQDSSSKIPVPRRSKIPVPSPRASRVVIQTKPAIASSFSDVLLRQRLPRFQLPPPRFQGSKPAIAKSFPCKFLGWERSQISRLQPLPYGLRGQFFRRIRPLRIHFVMSFCATGIQDPKIPTSPPPKIPRFQIGHFETISHFVSGLEGVQDSKSFPKEGQGSFLGQTGDSEFILQ